MQANYILRSAVRLILISGATAMVGATAWAQAAPQNGVTAAASGVCHGRPSSPEHTSGWRVCNQ